jgi:acyl-CoA dehydrogenase
VTTQPTWSLLPMFFDEPHRALGRACESIDHPTLHDANRVIPRLGESRLLGFLVPAKYGGRSWAQNGANVDVRALCIIREALAYVSPMADSIFAVQGLGSYPLVLAGEADRRASVMVEVVQGRRVCAFALTEPEAGSDVASMQTTARADGETFVLDGEKIFISNVGIATQYVVFANADPAAGKKGISAFLVDAGTPGLFAEPMPAGIDHPLGKITLHGCRVPKSALLGSVGMGLKLALGTLDLFRTSVGAAAIGMARRAFDEAIGHVRTRVQFGKTLGEQQLTQAALAEMLTDLDASRLLVCRAAWEKDQGAPSPDGISVAMAKMHATESAQRIIDRAVQLLGGRGIARGVVESLYREIRPLRIYEGTTEIQKLIIGRALTRI